MADFTTVFSFVIPGKDGFIRRMERLAGTRDFDAVLGGQPIAVYFKTMTFLIIRPEGCWITMK
jgi:hypothetical protein